MVWVPKVIHAAVQPALLCEEYKKIQILMQNESQSVNTLKRLSHLSIVDERNISCQASGSRIGKRVVSRYSTSSSKRAALT
jgi:hypothetical protein